MQSTEPEDTSRDSAWEDEAERHETPVQCLDRNWGDHHRARRRVLRSCAQPARRRRVTEV